MLNRKTIAIFKVEKLALLHSQLKHQDVNFNTLNQQKNFIMAFYITALFLPIFSSAQSFQNELQQALTENYNDDVSPQVLRLQNIASQIMEKRVNETSEEDANELLRLLGKRGGAPDFRMIGQTGTLFNSIVNFKDIAEYGCWCKLAEAGKGWGTPMDEIDSACKVFQHCRRCIQLEDEGASGCDPVEQSYAIGPY